jgi:hypothetical protein
MLAASPATLSVELVVSEAVDVTAASCVLLCRSAVVLAELDAWVIIRIPLAIVAMTITDSSVKPLVFLSMFVHLLHRQVHVGDELLSNFSESIPNSARLLPQS